MEIMKPFIGGQFVESKSEKFNTIYNPSTGEAIAQVPCCTNSPTPGRPPSPAPRLPIRHGETPLSASAQAS